MCHCFLGIGDYPSALQWIQEHSPCYRENPETATVFAWIHTHVKGNRCFLSSIDLHNQFLYEKYFPHILAIVIEIGRENYNDIQFYKLSKKGTLQMNQCNIKALNNPLGFHDSCANDETLFDNLTQQVVCIEKAPFEVIDAREKNQLNQNANPGQTGTQKGNRFYTIY